ncbi:MAG: VCBS repeat-containing protein, partial [Ignavibacteria bacterium]
MVKKILLAISFFIIQIFTSLAQETVDNGFIFIDGRYIEAPYKVEVRDMTVYINNVQISNKIPWPQPDLRILEDPGMPKVELKRDDGIKNLTEVRDENGKLIVMKRIRYFLQNFELNIATSKIIEYLGELKIFKTLNLDKFGVLQVEDYNGKSENIFLSPIKREAPPTLNQVLESLNRREKQIVSELKRGKSIFYFDRKSIVKFGSVKTANLLPKLLKILEDKSTNNFTKIKLMEDYGIFSKNSPNSKMLIKNFKSNYNLQKRISNHRNVIKEEFGEKVFNDSSDQSYFQKRNNLHNKAFNPNQSYSDVSQSIVGIDYYAYYQNAFQHPTVYLDEINNVSNAITPLGYNSSSYIYVDDVIDDTPSSTLDQFLNGKNASIFLFHNHGFIGYSMLAFFENLSTAQEYVGLSGDNYEIKEGIFYLIKVGISPSGTCENPEGIEIVPYGVASYDLWFFNNFNIDLTLNNSLVIFNTCFSGNNIASQVQGNLSVAGAMGGGAGLGWFYGTFSTVTKNLVHEFMSRMNGSIGNGQYRSAKSAFENLPPSVKDAQGDDFELDDLKIFPRPDLDQGTPVVTLCPAVKELSPINGASGLSGTGTGYIEFDTYCLESDLNQALNFYTTGNVTISDIKWVDHASTENMSNRIEFDWEGYNNFQITVNVNSDHIRSWDVDQSFAGHKLDFDGIAPNTENGQFTFSGTGPDPTLVITSPAGLDKWTVGKAYDIQWTLSNEVTNYVKIEISKDDVWETIEESYAITSDNMSYSYTPSWPQSDNCKIRITDTENTSITDESDVFSIDPMFTITSPNDWDNKFYPEENIFITWEWNDFDENLDVTNMRIEYSIDNGINWIEIHNGGAQSTQNSNTKKVFSIKKLERISLYTWEIPNTPSSECFLRLTQLLSNPANFCISSQFIIYADPFVSVTSPTSGEVWYHYYTKEISWEKYLVNNVTIDYSKDGGSTWTEIVSNLDANQTPHNWTVPSTFTSSNCKIRITDATNSSVKDESEVFTIKAPPETYFLEHVSLLGLNKGAVDWADYDNDGDMDLAVIGDDKDNIQHFRIYRNDSGNFEELNLFPGYDVLNGYSGAYYTRKLEWVDYDADGDLDLFSTFLKKASYEFKLFENINGNLTKVNAGLPDVLNGRFDFADYDDDNDLDLLLMGEFPDVTDVYRNDNGTFYAINAGLEFFKQGDCKWGDFNDDGLIDIVLSGQNSSGQNKLKIYINDGTSFSEEYVHDMGWYKSDLDLEDYDNDGDLDLVVIGDPPGQTRLSEILRNNFKESGTLELIGNSIEYSEYGDVKFGDFNNDGYEDLILTGTSSGGNPITNILFNDNAGTFSSIGDLQLNIANLEKSSVDWADFDNDGDLDFALSGRNTTNYFTKIYQNVLNPPQMTYLNILEPKSEESTSNGYYILNRESNNTFQIKQNKFVDIEAFHTNSDYTFSFWSDGIIENKRHFNAIGNHELSAIFKKSHATASPSAFSNTNQHKVVQTYNGNLHMVYESMGYVWYEVSTDNGATWTLANDGKPLSSNEAKNPSIANELNSTNNDVLIVFQQKNNDGQTNDIIVKYYDGITGLETYEEIIESQFGDYSNNLSPVIAWSESDGTLTYHTLAVVYTKKTDTAGIYYTIH